MNTIHRRHVLGIAAAHCASAFAALGLPPYLGVLLPQLGDPSARWAGILYVVPTLFAALSASMWGKLSDRFGPKRLLVRAQLGLAAAFGLAAVAQDLPTLVVALVAQGVLGGTYSASTAYLASGLAGEPLTRALALMQGSARTALVAAPVLAGLLAGVLDVRQMYGLAALLPLGATLGMLRMPAPVRFDAIRPHSAGPATTDGDGAPRRTITLAGLCMAEAGFVLVTVSTYPYFVPLMHLVAPWLPAWAPGVLFAAPHVLCTSPLRPWPSASCRGGHEPASRSPTRQRRRLPSYTWFRSSSPAREPSRGSLPEGCSWASRLPWAFPPCPCSPRTLRPTILPAGCSGVSRQVPSPEPSSPVVRPRRWPHLHQPPSGPQPHSPYPWPPASSSLAPRAA